MIRYAVTPALTRRDALRLSGTGFGYLAFLGLAAAKEAGETVRSSADPLAPKAPHFAPKAKRVIFLSMAGGPSHVDTFDYKPQLIADDGKAVPGRRGIRGGTLLAPVFNFARHGQSGLWASDAFPELAKRADDLCVLNGMHTTLPAHAQAFLQLHTGSFQFVRPSLGAWTLYGLGTENRNLPGFVSVNPPVGRGGAQNYGSAFLPAIYQGTRIAVGGRFAGRGGLSNIANPKLGTAAQRLQLDFIQALNREGLERDGGSNPHVEGVIESYELAFRMQADVPKVMDLSSESKDTHALYGIGEPGSDTFGRQCLLARRFVEAGVRFVELTHGGWDQHRNLKAEHARHAAAVDKPIAGLLTDLKRRGLLGDTLVVWSGEFGRTPYSQGTDGRDHNNKGFSAWLAGGGVKGGFAHGQTDEYGREAVEGKVHIHDLHATILYLLGLDHERLTFNYAGRDFRLTDVHGNVVKEIIA